MRTKDDIQEPEYSEVCTLVSVVSKMVLSAFVKVKEIRAERSQGNAPMNRVRSPVLPHQISSIRLCELFSTIKTQENCLLFSWKEADIVILEDETRVFKQHFAQHPSARDAVERFADSVAKSGDVFDEAWEHFKTRF